MKTWDAIYQEWQTDDGQIHAQRMGFLIRCKDCKHWDISWQTIEGKHYCSYIDMHQSGDWYCAWAERKEE